MSKLILQQAPFLYPIRLSITEVSAFFVPFFKSSVIGLLCCIMVMNTPNAHATSNPFEKTIGDRVLTLWADKKNCFEKGVFMVSIESKGDAYKIAACSPLGCRITIPEFGNQFHPVHYRLDPMFTWISNTVFETTVNGKKRRFYQCQF